jgi:hypothetical protein
MAFVRIAFIAHHGDGARQFLYEFGDELTLGLEVPVEAAEVPSEVAVLAKTTANIRRRAETPFVAVRNTSALEMTGQRGLGETFAA